MNKQDAAYRDLLTKTAQESQSDYDKAVLTLSGGALGVSIAFVKEIIGPSNATGLAWLSVAWLSWGVSCASVLVSYYTSAIALRKAIDDFDENPEGEGSSWKLPDFITRFLNALSGSCFLIGLFCFCWFAVGNLSRHMERPSEPPREPQVKIEKGQPVPARPPDPSPSPIVVPGGPSPQPSQPQPK